MTHPAHRKPRKHARQEGAALLIVLLILLMATSTGMYVMQSTQFEVRAAGALHQAVRTKLVAEAATVSVLGLCYQTTVVGCTEMKRAPDNLTKNTRLLYALPNYGKRETVYSLTQVDLAGNSFAASPLPDDKTIAGGGAAAPYTPSFDTVIEKWDVPTPGETQQRYRLIVSTFGALNYDTDAKLDTVNDVRATGDLRYAHQSISATRAFFDLR